MFIKLTTSFDKRSVIINTEHIMSIEPEFNGTGSKLLLTAGTAENVVNYTVVESPDRLGRYLKAEIPPASY